MTIGNNPDRWHVCKDADGNDAFVTEEELLVAEDWLDQNFGPDNRTQEQKDYGPTRVC
jgi:hypothetical protein